MPPAISAFFSTSMSSWNVNSTGTHLNNQLKWDRKRKKLRSPAANLHLDGHRAPCVARRLCKPYTVQAQAGRLDDLPSIHPYGIARVYPDVLDQRSPAPSCGDRDADIDASSYLTADP